MKRLLIILSTILSAIPLSAQKPLENDEIFATVGVNVPMYKNMESDVVVGLHYGHYYPNGRYVQVVRGLWEMENDIMGGPFVSHSVVDEINNRVIVVEAFLYAPNRKKGSMMRKLEASLFTLKLPADKFIEESTRLEEFSIEEKK